MLARALAVLLVLSVAAAGVQTWRIHAMQTRAAEARAAQAEADRIRERAAVVRNQEIDRATQLDINAARLAAAAARLAGLLGQAAGLVAECQERGGALAAQVTGLPIYQHGAVPLG